MKPNPILIGALVLVTLLCVFSTFRSCTASDRPDEFYDYVGTRAGEAVADEMSSGTALFLLRPGVQETPGVFGTMIDACAAALEKRGITVLRQELNAIELDDMESETSVSADRFKQALAAQSGGSIDMVVSFVGVPPASLRKAPPVYVVAAAEAECRSAHERKQIVGALAMKPWDTLSGQTISDQPAKRFEQTCTMIP